MCIDERDSIVIIINLKMRGLRMFDRCVGV